MDKIKLKCAGNTVFATELTVDEFESLQSRAAEVSDMEFNRMIIAECIRDESGAKVFDSIAAVGKVGLKEYQKLQGTVLMVNGMSDDEKN